MDRSQPVTGLNGRARPKHLYDDSDDEKMGLQIDNIRDKARTPYIIYILTFFSALGGFLFGYDASVISDAMILIRNEFGLSHLWQELLIAVTVTAAAFFALIGGLMNDKLGRRCVILCACSTFTAAATLMGIAADKYMLLVGRIVTGASVGLMSTTVPMYLAECSPAHIRGLLVSTYIAMVTCGQCVATIINGIFVGDEKNGWRYMLGLAGVPSFLQFVGFIFMPESPRWLMISSQEEKARRVLQSVRGQLDIDAEYESIKSSMVDVEQDKQLSCKAMVPVTVEMMKFAYIRRALTIGCLLQIIQQVAGINTVMYYSATIIKMSGVYSDEAANWLSAFTTFLNCVFTVLGLYLVEKIGRRHLMLGSLIGTIASLVFLAAGFYVSSINTPHLTMDEQTLSNSTCSSYSTCNDCTMDSGCGFCFADSDTAGISNTSCLPINSDNPWVSSLGLCSSHIIQSKLIWAHNYCPSPFSWVPLVGLILYIISFAPGMGPMPWTINSEIYPLWARSSAISISTFTNWMFNLIISVSFQTLTDNLTRFGTFLLYAGLSLLGALLLLIWLPETKGKSLEETEGLFANSWFGISGEVNYNTKTIQYVHIRGLNRDGCESELESPE